MKAVLVLLLVTVSLCAALSPDLNEKMRFRRRRAFPDDWTWGASTGVVCPSLPLTTVAAPMQPETISYRKADGTTASFTFPKCGAKPEGDQRKTCVNEAYDGMVPVLDLAKKTFDTFLFDLVHDINKNLNPTGAAGNIKDAALSQDTAHLVSVRLKQKGPATEKILKTTANEGYDGEPRRLIDAVRASVVFKDFTNLAKAVCFLRKSAKQEGAKVAIIKEKDNTKTTDSAKTMGYLDYKFTLKVGGEGGNGLLSEVQFLVCPLFHAKMGKLDEGENGHTLYEKWRVLPADSAERKPLADKSIELYAKYTPPNGAKVSSVKCVDSVNEEKVEASFDKPTSPDSA